MNMRQPMIVEEWLALVVLLCNPQETEQATANMAPMVPFLQRFEAWVFCPASAEAVEAYDRRRAVPGLSEITKPLDGWVERTPAPDFADRKRIAAEMRALADSMGIERPTDPRRIAG